MSVISYSNVRVYEDNGTLCILGNNPMLTACQTADESPAAILALNSLDEVDHRPIDTRKLKLSFESEIRRSVFKPQTIYESLQEMTSDFSQTSFDWTRGVSISGYE